MKQAFALRECRFFDLDTDKYLGFCRNGELHPLALPFEPTACRIDKGPFRHQFGRKRK